MPTRETPTHSPAPWMLDESRIYGIVRDANGRRLVTLDGTSPDDDRLFLKAPELLSTCREYVRRCEHDEDALRANPIALYAKMKALVDHIDGGGE